MHRDRLPRNREEIAALIPHQGSMCLLEAVVEATEHHVVCVTRSHANEENPLRRGDRLPAMALCEYGAQAMAVHGGLAARKANQPPSPGLLVALRDVEFAVADIHGAGTLQVRAERLQATASAWQYGFTVSRAGQALASGRATVMLRRE